VVITELNKKECWLPGASIWVTKMDKKNPWLSAFDYHLNFQISKILKLNSQLCSLNSNQKDLLLIAPQGMLPTELVVILESWQDISKLNRIKLPYQITTVRLFNPDKNLILLEELKSNFQFELVPVYE